MTGEVRWPRWPVDQPELLADYVVPDEVARRTGLAGRGPDGLLSQVRAVFESLKAPAAGAPIRYAFERDVIVNGEQVVRTPAEVLRLPRNG